MHAIDFIVNDSSMHNAYVYFNFFLRFFFSLVIVINQNVITHFSNETTVFSPVTYARLLQSISPLKPCFFPVSLQDGI